MVQFKVVDENEFVGLLAQAEKCFRPKRYSRQQFQKYFGQDCFWHIVLLDGVMVAGAAVRHWPRNIGHIDDCMLIAEIQSFVKGYGKVLLGHLSFKYRNVWLAVDPDGGKSLSRYYQGILKQFGWEEVVVQNSKFNHRLPQSFWFKAGNKQNADVLKSYIIVFQAKVNG